MYHIEFHERIKTPFTVCISALVPEIFEFEICVKYANEMTETSHTQLNIISSTILKYINRAILANLQHRPLKLGRLIVLQKTHLWL